ncbi:MAG: glycosyltransferase family 2 protein [Clostridia bacterium]|nr:glycosyltransferase family 2 protein [Clostridia bacterium]
MSPKISVIIPVYNVEQYLRECLDSVVSQTLADIEIIAINDGSPDNSLSILKEYEAKDTRVKIIDKQNEGVGKARNDGIKAAAGEFVAFMDSDDYYPSEKVLEILYDSAVKTDVKICGGVKVKLNTDGSLEKQEPCFEEAGLQFNAKGLTKYSDYQYDYGYTQFIFERRLLTENGICFPPYKRFQDPPFFVKAMAAAGEFYMTECESYCYRMVPAETKYSVKNTVDFLHGLIDNIEFSRRNNLAKLHCLCAKRLDGEGSFMAIKNLQEDDAKQIISLLIKATAVIDTGWLRESGFELPEPFVPGVFDYMITTAAKYEALRKNKFLKIVKKITG